MPAPTQRRMTADIEGDFVVFMIGMRINRLWKVHKWLPVFRAMPRMLRELHEHPEKGFLGHTLWLSWRTPMVVQYWRSFEELEAYARDRDAEHWPAWRAFNRTVASNGDVGIFHETYRVRAGEYESVYNNMPPFGLGAVSNLVPATGRRERAADRMGMRRDGGMEAEAIAQAGAPERSG